jgi:peptidoglycan/LPS O-acetylase OafA/YrhL
MTAPTALLYGGTQLTLIGQDAVWFTQFDAPSGSARFTAKLPSEEPTTPESTTPAGRQDPASAQSPPSLHGFDFLFVAQAWTLGVELLFYCVAPFLVRSLGRIGLFFALSWIVRLTLAYFGYKLDPWSYRFFPSELAMFLMGSAGYQLYARLEPREDLMRRIGIVALPLMVLMIVFLFKFEMPLRTLMVTFATAACVPFVFALTKRNRFDRWIGELSYPVYITHELVRLALIDYRGSAHVVTMVWVTLLVSVSVMLCVEQPFERARAKFIDRRRARDAERRPA